MKIRNGFVSNSSSSSFVIPKKYLSEEELDIYHEYVSDCDFCDEELREGEMYIYGKVSYHNKELNRMFKKHIKEEGVEYTGYD
jgi:hypothetical protein